VIPGGVGGIQENAECIRLKRSNLQSIGRKKRAIVYTSFKTPQKAYTAEVSEIIGKYKEIASFLYTALYTLETEKNHELTNKRTTKRIRPLQP